MASKKSRPENEALPNLPKPIPSKNESNDEYKKVESDNQVSSSNVISLSVEETNALRAKIGLPPLKTSNETSNNDTEDKKEALKVAEKAGGTLIPNSSKNEVHVPATNISQMTEAEKIRERIKQRRYVL